MSDTQPQVRPYPGIRIELDVTPRWWGTREDAADVARTIHAYDGLASRLISDVQIGESGVRLVLVSLSGISLDAFEAERCAIKALLDALDGVHPRRARVTAERKTAAEAQARRAAEAQAAKPIEPAQTTPPKAPPPTPQPHDDAPPRPQPQRRPRGRHRSGP